jgi:monoamine oxidase
MIHPLQRRRGASMPGRLVLLLLDAALLLASTPPPAAAQTPKPNSAVVVGAGLAGLAAADSLCAKGYSVTILEARDRTGGRAHTVRLPLTGVQAEAGAGWLHDASPNRNSLAKLAADNDLPTLVDDGEQQAWLVTDAPPTAATAVSASRLGRWEDRAAGFEDEISEDAEDSWSASRSLLHYYDQWLAAAGQTDLKGDDLAGVRALLQSGVADLEYGASMSKMSAKWSDEGEQGEADERVLKDGYKSVVALLEQRIASRASCRHALNLDSRVTDITTVSRGTASRRGVYIKTINGSTISGRFGVVTLPLGVLRSPTQSPRFTPPLSSEKKAALSKGLAMGLLNKVVLVYDDASFFQRDGAGGAAWPSEVSWFSPVTSATNPRPPAEGEAFEFWSIQKFWPGSNAVAMLIGGDTAAKWEASGGAAATLAEKDLLVAERADALFRQLFPSTTAKLREYLVTRWASDPYSLGAYSYVPVGGSQSARSRLCAAQGGGLLYFAGEHCSLSYPSTANGAFSTGVAAAGAAMRKFPVTVANGRRRG